MIILARTDITKKGQDCWYKQLASTMLIPSGKHNDNTPILLMNSTKYKASYFEAGAVGRPASASEKLHYIRRGLNPKPPHKKLKP